MGPRIGRDAALSSAPGEGQQPGGGVIAALVADFINALITFLIIAAVVFFFVIKPVNHLLERMRPGKAIDEPTRPCPECLSDIPEAATRCAFCTTTVAPAA
jgi:large-conductance mechanosensitive channel